MALGLCKFTQQTKSIHGRALLVPNHRGSTIVTVLIDDVISAGNNFLAINDGKCGFINRLMKLILYNYL